MSKERLVRIVAWSCLCFIVYATLSLLRDRPALLASPSIERFASFAILGALFCLAYPQRLSAVLIFILGSAVLLEALQLLTVDRHAQIIDAVQKIAGGAAGIFASRALLIFGRARSWLQEPAKR
jgi:hypothetical protein